MRFFAEGFGAVGRKGGEATMQNIDRILRSDELVKLVQSNNSPV